MTRSGRKPIVADQIQRSVPRYHSTLTGVLQPEPLEDLSARELGVGTVPLTIVWTPSEQYYDWRKQRFDHRGVDPIESVDSLLQKSGTEIVY